MDTENGLVVVRDWGLGWKKWAKVVKKGFTSSYKVHKS